MEDVNQLAQAQLDDILTHPTTTSAPCVAGGWSFRCSDGRGTFFCSEGTFRGFFESIKVGTFTVDLVGDLEYEEFTAHIYHQDDGIAVVTQELGVEQMKIELRSPEEEHGQNYDLNEFVHMLGRVRAELISCRG